MWLPRTCVLLVLLALSSCERHDDDDTASVFMEAARSFLANKDTMNGIQGIASAFIQSDTGKQVGEMFTGENSNVDGLGQIVSGIGSLFAGDRQQQQGADFSVLGTILEAVVSGGKSPRRASRETGETADSGMDLESIVNLGRMFIGQKGNSDILMGFLPMLLQGFSGGNGETDGEPARKHDHSGHSWYMPPILEHLHVMWDHFSNSELGQTLWKNSGLSKIVSQMSDPRGNIQYEQILESFENPSLRRRWIKSLTNYVAEWFSYISDPAIQQRYLSTVQFVGNGFLKSQGFPKTAMFDATRPTESISRLVNAVGQRHLGMRIDSSQYIKPAVAYFQELLALASEKGFIMSRINAREMSNKLSDTINNDLIGPILKAYRAYKWSIKTPQCASQILCTINEKTGDDEISRVRSGLLKVASFPAAWAVSNKLGMNFWVLYGAIMEHERCVQKYPADCTTFHEEELRVTTESIHNEL